MAAYTTEITAFGRLLAGSNADLGMLSVRSGQIAVHPEFALRFKSFSFKRKVTVIISGTVVAFRALPHEVIHLLLGRSRFHRYSHSEKLVYTLEFFFWSLVAWHPILSYYSSLIIVLLSALPLVMKRYSASVEQSPRAAKSRNGAA